MRQATTRTKRGSHEHPEAAPQPAPRTTTAPPTPPVDPRPSEGGGGRRRARRPGSPTPSWPRSGPGRRRRPRTQAQESREAAAPRRHGGQAGPVSRVTDYALVEELRQFMAFPAGQEADDVDLQRALDAGRPVDRLVHRAHASAWAPPPRPGSGRPPPATSCPWPTSQDAAPAWWRWTRTATAPSPPPWCRRSTPWSPSRGPPFDALRAWPTPAGGEAPRTWWSSSRGSWCGSPGGYGYTDARGRCPAPVAQANLLLGARWFKRREVPFQVLQQGGAGRLPGGPPAGHRRGLPLLFPLSRPGSPGAALLASQLGGGRGPVRGRLGDGLMTDWWGSVPVTLRLEGADELERALRRTAPPCCAPRRQQAMTRSLLLIEADARRNVRQDTRRLMNSISHRQSSTPRGLVGEVGPSAALRAPRGAGHPPPLAPPGAPGGLGPPARRPRLRGAAGHRPAGDAGPALPAPRLPQERRGRIVRLFAAAGARAVATLGTGGGGGREQRAASWRRAWRRRAETIPGLRCYAEMHPKPEPPAMCVGGPIRWTYDETMDGHLAPRLRVLGLRQPGQPAPGAAGAVRLPGPERASRASPPPSMVTRPSVAPRSDTRVLGGARPPTVVETAGGSLLGCRPRGRGAAM